MPDARVDYDELADTFDRRYERHDYSGVAQALMAFTGPPAPRVLEVGCGTGHWLAVLTERGVAAAGIDVSAAMLRRARTRLPAAPLAQATAERLPCVPASFDRIFCLNAVHHFPDPRGFIHEAQRVLRPGGGLMTIGLDPHVGVSRWFVYEYFAPALAIDTRRYPSTERIRDWMAEAGFTGVVTRQVQRWQARTEAREALRRGYLARTATSQLAILEEGEYRAGLDRLHQAIAAAGAKGQALWLDIDLALYATSGTVALGADSRKPSSGSDDRSRVS